MSKIFVNGTPIGQTFSPNFNLNSLLSNSVVQRTNDDVVNVQLTEPGVYYITKTICFCCNLIIEGCEGAIIEVKFSTANDYSDDSFLEFINIYQGVYHRRNIVIKNIEFKINNSHFWSSSYPSFHFLKFYASGSVHIDNVKMRLDGHPITNFDFRECWNVVIENCLLENYHDNVQETNIGGVIWFSGNVKNVKIINNILKKAGNDELLAFFGHYLDDTNVVVPDDEKPPLYLCKKDNIIVQNNIIVYKRPVMTGTDYSNDCLVVLCDYDTINPSSQGTKQHLFENIIFESNNFFINDHCKSIFNTKFEEQTILRNVCYQNNNIEVGDFNVNGGYVAVFSLTNKFPGIDTIYEISGNTLYNKAEIKYFANVDDQYNEPALFFLIQNGGKVSIKDNITRISEDTKFKKVRFLWNNYFTNKTIIENNDLDGIFILGSLDCAPNRSLTCDLLIKDNIIKGDTRIYCNNLTDMKLTLDGNYIESYNDVIALQEGAGSIFNYINNHVVVHEPISSFYYSFNNHNIDSCCVANNVFENLPSNAMYFLNNNVTSSVQVIQNNIQL